jgi:hypothetical protein
MAEHYRLPFAAILVANLCAVSRRDCGHMTYSPLVVVQPRFTFNTRVSTDSAVQQILRRSPFSCLSKGPPPVGFA